MKNLVIAMVAGWVILAVPALAQEPAPSGQAKPLEREKSLVPEKDVAAPKAEAKGDELDGAFAFDYLKKLAGEWDGHAMTEDGDSMSDVWRVTANGNALVETQFPGTDHEMMSVYFLDGKDLVLTHYCAMGNQPRMKFDPAASSWNIYEFRFDGGTNIDKTKTAHIHSGTIHFQGADKMKAEWVLYSGGKKAGSKIFLLSRKEG